jgi:hypothetical protein
MVSVKEQDNGLDVRYNIPSPDGLMLDMDAEDGLLSSLWDDLEDLKLLDAKELDAFVSEHVQSKHEIRLNTNSSRVVAEKLMMTRGTISQSCAASSVSDLVNSGEIWSMIKQPAHISPNPDDVRVSDQYPTAVQPITGCINRSTNTTARCTPPKYETKSVMRGDDEDTYFRDACYEDMTENADVIDVVTTGSDEDVLAICNFSNQGPTTKVKCDLALETKMFVDAVWTLISENNIMNKADIYRYIAVMPDRMCLYCKKPSSKVSCISGSFKCQNCINKTGKVSFADGFAKWMNAGCPIRHAVII